MVEELSKTEIQILKNLKESYKKVEDATYVGFRNGIVKIVKKYYNPKIREIIANPSLWTNEIYEQMFEKGFNIGKRLEKSDIKSLIYSLDDELVKKLVFGFRNQKYSIKEVNKALATTKSSIRVTKKGQEILEELSNEIHANYIGTLWAAYTDVIALKHCEQKDKVKIDFEKFITKRSLFRYDKKLGIDNYKHFSVKTKELLDKQKIETNYFLLLNAIRIGNVQEYFWNIDSLETKIEPMELSEIMSDIF